LRVCASGCSVDNVARIVPRLALACALTAASFALAAPAVANHKFDVVDKTPKVSTLVYEATSPVGVEELWAATTDGERRRRIARASTFNRAPGWTPCCRKMNLLVGTGTGFIRPLELEIDGTDRRFFSGKLSNEIYSVDLSQRSGRIVFGDENALWIMSPDGSRRRIRDFGPYGPVPSDGLAISPTGTSVAFGYRPDRPPGQDGPRPNHQVWVMDADGSNARAIYESPDEGGGNPASDFDFTAQGGRLVFGEGRDDDDENESVDLYIANTLGFGASRVPATPNVNEHLPLFNPKASQIAYVADTERFGDFRNDALRIMGVGGGRDRTLVKANGKWQYSPLVWVNAKWQKRTKVRH
jgi:Tol biopolymer transport system component